MSRRSARKHSFCMLFQYIFMEDSELNENLGLYYDTHDNIGDIDKEFIESKLRGVISHLSEIDCFISRYAKDWSIDRLSKVDLTILRLAVFEIKYSSDIPVKVAVNEAVELAKAYSTDESPAFINGILGSVVKEV